MSSAERRGSDAAPDPVPVPPPEVTKGILHPREQERHRSLVRWPAGPGTAEFVEFYWSVSWDLRGRAPYRAQVLAFPSINVSFERTATRTGGFVTGVCTTKYVRELSGVGDTFAAKFRPGGFGAFTGIDVGALRDTAVALPEVLPDAAELTEQVLSASDLSRQRGLVEAYFRRAAADLAPDANYRLLLHIVAAMEADPDLTRVDQVTARFDIAVRTLQRLFRRYVGVGPKWVLRRYRLQDGAQLLAQGRSDDLAALALELGYFDQAHFSREFAREIGMAPLEYARVSLMSQNATSPQH